MSLKINVKNRIILSALISSAIIFSLIFFVILPSIEEIKKIGRETKDLRIDLENKYIKGQSLRKLSESLKIIEAQIPNLEKMFIKKSEDINFVSSLEDIANTSGVKQKITLSDISEKNNEKYQKNSLQIFTNGNFNEQINYLSALEKLNYYINIKSLEISHSSSDNIFEDGNKNTDVMIFADTYWIEE